MVPALAWAAPWEARVVRVVDGDTLYVVQEADRPYERVRLAGFDAPELDEAGGIEAREELEAWVADGPVWIEDRARDRWARLVADVGRLEEGQLVPYTSD